MNPQKSYLARIVLISIALAIFSAIALSQTRPTLVINNPGPRQPLALATGNNLYCAGFIQSGSISTGNKIIGAQEESDRFIYSQNNFVYINMGRDKGVNVGDVFAVVRPRATVKSKWSKKGDLGFYVQEVGALEIVNVKQEVSVARVKTSCDNFQLGDLVQLTEQRTSPMYAEKPALDRFGDPSGKATGRILMARDGAEMLTRDFIAYVDLGADNNVRVGDTLTIFRKLEKGNILHEPHDESITARDYGFESEEYKGGRFSNQAPRKTGDKAGGSEVTVAEVRADRPSWLRKVVGEAVVLNVKEKTATIVITRTAQEIHTGDWVEIQ